MDRRSVRRSCGWLSAALTLLALPAPARAETHVGDGVEVQVSAGADGAAPEEGAVAGALKSYFRDGRVHTAKAPVDDALVDRVVDALFGDTAARPQGWAPSAANRASVARTVHTYMEAGLPIEGVTFWAGRRNYGQHGPWGPDLSDVLGIRRYEQVNRAVKAAGYSPGIRARIVLEDLGPQAMGPRRRSCASIARG
jgi:hypothetical protein